MTDYKEIIIKVVNENSGIKGVELSLRVITIINPLKFNKNEYLQSLLAVVEDGEILELEFTLSHLDYRVRSIFFPRGTILFPKGTMIKSWKQPGE